MGVGRKNVQGFFGSIALPRTTHCLAINGNNAFDGSNQAIDPCRKTSRKGLAVQKLEDTPKCFG